MAISIPNRPFSTEPITGLMMPDGIFEVALGIQRINAHFLNEGATAVNDLQFYVESVSHPGIVVSPDTYFLSNAQSGVAYLYSWNADFSACPPGIHYVSFIVENASGKQRIIKKIFVTEVQFDTATKYFTVATPEGTMRVGFEEFVGPAGGGCCHPKPAPGDLPPKRPNDKQEAPAPDILIILRDEIRRGLKPDFKFCSPYYLISKLHLDITPTPPFSGQYGDLPFQDPWWKIVLCVVALLLLTAAAIAEATLGSGSLSVGSGGGGGGTSGSGTSDNRNCCGTQAQGGGTSYAAASLTAAAATTALIAAASDVRDPIRRGQDNTPPQPGEITVGENLKAALSYTHPVKPGTPFVVGLTWKYTRTTTGNTYTYSATDANANIHVLSRYEIKAPDVVRVYKRDRFTVEASFFDSDGNIVCGGALFVQCFLIGPQGRWQKISLQDHGDGDDRQANDGIYTGGCYFSSSDAGLWTYYVIAQDVNNAQPDMKPEEAAQIIGGMLLTNQLTISFDPGTCDFVPDGHVNVIVGN
jgi:PKD repeat protein